MANGIFRVPAPANEPVLEYRPGSAERDALKRTLDEMASSQVDIPLIIGGKEVRTGNVAPISMPHLHGHRLGQYHQAGAREVQMAIEAAERAWAEWSEAPWEERAAVFLKAADLLSGPFRPVLNAATMLCQSKTAHQAEIDSACELIDFYRFNPWYLQQIYEQQPSSARGVWNRSEYRPLEGFVFAITPFNFTAIAGNLPTSPAVMGNTVVWKPAAATVYSGYYIYKLLEAAGLPPGVINFVAGPPGEISRALLSDRRFAGIHFTGSTEVFNSMWRTVGENLPQYKGYPRLVGETGGKDFVVAHASAEVEALSTALVRGAFEYQGQKCSAASRAYVPDSLWPRLKEQLLAQIAEIRVGDVRDFRNFMGAVIDRKGFQKIGGYIELAAEGPGTEILCGGKPDDREGYFIPPTLVQVQDPRHRLMVEEIFGPVLSLYVYPESRYAETLKLCDEGSPYALTGSIFATDRRAIAQAHQALRHAAGNFYVNDKPTGAVVGQQPFGGARASGTNDKAGSPLNLLRWVSARTIKETFVPPRGFAYPFMAER
jgi:1-pyrroline-5-carboxylate dehydrogenase